MGQSNSSGAMPLPQGPDEAPVDPEVSWWCKLLARSVGAVGGIIAIVLGVMCCVTNILTPRCIGAGVLQIFAGFVVLIFEAPICCQFLEITKPVGSFAEKRPFFQKAIIFVVISITPIALCFGLLTLFGAGLLFACGVLYGLMALGKKADRETMMANAQGRVNDSAGLIDNEAAVGNTDRDNPFTSK